MSVKLSAKWCSYKLGRRSARELVIRRRLSSSRFLSPLWWFVDSSPVIRRSTLQLVSWSIAFVPSVCLGQLLCPRTANPLQPRALDGRSRRSIMRHHRTLVSCSSSPDRGRGHPLLHFVPAILLGICGIRCSSMTCSVQVHLLLASSSCNTRFGIRLSRLLLFPDARSFGGIDPSFRPRSAPATHPKEETELTLSNNLTTLSVGCAPTPNQYLTLSTSQTTLFSLLSLNSSAVGALEAR